MGIQRGIEDYDIELIIGELRSSPSESDERLAQFGI